MLYLIPFHLINYRKYDEIFKNIKKNVIFKNI